MNGKVRIASVRALRDAAGALQDCTGSPIHPDVLDFGATMLDEILTVVENVDLPLSCVVLMLQRGDARVVYDFVEGVQAYQEQPQDPAPVHFEVYVYPPETLEMSRFFAEMMKTDLGFRFTVERTPGADSVNLEEVRIIGGRLDNGDTPSDGQGVRHWSPTPPMQGQQQMQQGPIPPMQYQQQGAPPQQYPPHEQYPQQGVPPQQYQQQGAPPQQYPPHEPYQQQGAPPQQYPPHEQYPQQITQHPQQGAGETNLDRMMRRDRESAQRKSETRQSLFTRRAYQPPE